MTADDEFGLPPARVRSRAPHVDAIEADASSPTKPGAYAVGFGKPPKAHRWRKGQSGNPKGRPQGTRNAATIMEQIMGEPVSLKINGRPQRVSTLEGMLRRQVQIAMIRGDINIVKHILSILEQANSTRQQALAINQADNLEKSDVTIIEDLLRREANFLNPDKAP